MSNYNNGYYPNNINSNAEKQAARQGLPNKAVFTLSGVLIFNQLYCQYTPEQIAENNARRKAKNPRTRDHSLRPYTTATISNPVLGQVSPAQAYPAVERFINAARFVSNSGNMAGIPQIAVENCSTQLPKVYILNDDKQSYSSQPLHLTANLAQGTPVKLQCRVYEGEAKSITLDAVFVEQTYSELKFYENTATQNVLAELGIIMAPNPHLEAENASMNPTPAPVPGYMPNVPNPQPQYPDRAMPQYNPGAQPPVQPNYPQYGGYNNGSGYEPNNEPQPPQAMPNPYTNRAFVPGNAGIIYNPED